MAKIPQAAIDNIRNILAQTRSIEEQIVQLTNFVNQDSVDWNGIEIPITENIRDQMRAVYAGLKVQLSTLVAALP